MTMTCDMPSIVVYVTTPTRSPQNRRTSSSPRSHPTSVSLDRDIFSGFFSKLKNLQSLPSDWDSYGAEPPNLKSIYWTEEALHLLAEKSFVPVSVEASAENGAGIAFRKGSRYGDIEFLNNGGFFAVTANGAETPTVWRVAESKEEISLALEKIRAFLG